VTSDAVEPVEVTVVVDIYTVSGEKLRTIEEIVDTPINGSAIALTIDASPELEAHTPRGILVKLRLFRNDEVVSENLVTFARPKHLALDRPTLTVTEETASDGTPVIVLTTDKPALWTWLQVENNPDVRWDDNFFHVLPGERKVVRPQDGFAEALGAGKVIARNLYDTHAED